MQYSKIRNVLCRSKSFNVIQLIIKETRMCTGNKTVFSKREQRETNVDLTGKYDKAAGAAANSKRDEILCGISTE